MRTTFLSLALLPLLAAAQSWCPPGAKWTFEYTNILGGYSGVQRVEYVGDTLLSGFTAQRLDQTDVVALVGTTDYIAYPSFSLFTRYDNEVVFLWDNNSAYDTLFWFGAAPGDHWNVPGWPDGGNIVVTVLDTATEVIDALPLRRLVVEPSGGPADTVYERIGGLQLHLNAFIWFVTDVPYDGLLCYRDQDIEYAAPGVGDCGLTLALQDGQEARAAVPYPNPGMDRFGLSLPPGGHLIELFDEQGRRVRREHINGSTALIITSTLPSGLYTVLVDGQRPVRWVRE